MFYSKKLSTSSINSNLGARYPGYMKIEARNVMNDNTKKIIDNETPIFSRTGVLLTYDTSPK